MTTPKTIYEQTTAVCDRFFSLDRQIERAEQEHMVSGMIVDLVRGELAVAIERQAETRRKLMELRKAAIESEVR